MGWSNAMLGTSPPNAESLTAQKRGSLLGARGASPSSTLVPPAVHPHGRSRTSSAEGGPGGFPVGSASRFAASSSPAAGGFARTLDVPPAQASSVGFAVAPGARRRSSAAPAPGGGEQAEQPSSSRGGLKAALAGRPSPSALSASLPTELPASPAREPRRAERALLAAAQQRCPEAFGSRLVVRAFNVACGAHAGQVRKSGEPVLAHAVETAAILAEQGLDKKIVAAGLLHDTLDDTMMTEEQLRELFPGDVVDMVRGVSKMSQISQFHRDNWGSMDTGMVEQFKTMLLAMADVRVVLIKLADRLHNMRTLEHLPAHKQHKFAAETIAVFAPLANRLGVWNVKAELEDLCFRYLHTEQYATLKERVNDTAHFATILQSLDQIKSRLDGQGIDYKDLLGRPKNLYGIYSKMQSKGVALDEIYDVCAIRVIVNSEDECYRVLDQVHDLWPGVASKTKDYIKSPKTNGYQSLHTVVQNAEGQYIEVQIRTADMHYVAEYGVAAHWSYKEKKQGTRRLNQQIAWARWLLSWQMEIQDSKFRPSGSPPGNEMKATLASFPQEEPSPPAATNFDPIYVIMMRDRKMEIMEVQAGMTTEELGERIGCESRGMELLVNQSNAGKGYELQMGDQLELVSKEYVEEFFFSEDEFEHDVSYDSDIDQYDFEREKLHRQFSGHSRDALFQDVFSH